MLVSVVRHIVGLCSRYAWAVIAVAAIITVGSGYYSAKHFAITTDINKLIAPDIDWRLREKAYERDFPGSFGSILVVVDAPTPELATEASANLAKQLSTRPDLFHVVRQLDGDPFFAKNGLLFQPESDLARMSQGLGRGAPVIGALAGDPSLRGLTRALSFGLLGVQTGQAKLDDLQRALTMSADTVDQVLAGQPASFSWRVLLTGQAPQSSELRHFIEVQPVLDFSVAAARSGGDRCDPQSCVRPQAWNRLSGARPADRTGGDGGRGVRHAPGRRGGQRDRHDRHRADHPLACAAFAADHSGGLPQSRGRFCRNRRARIDDGRSAEPDFSCLRRAVCRPRRRFRHSIRGSIPVRALQERRPLFGAAQHRREGRRAFDAGRRRHRSGLPVVFPDRLQRRLRARPDRWSRHADRLCHHRHGAAGAAHHPAPAGRRGSDRLRCARAGRPVPGAPSHSGDRRHHPGGGRWIAVALLSHLRFQSDQSAKPDRRVGRDVPRPADRSDARRQRDQRVGAEVRQRRRRRRSASQDP